jgi:4'-phosphopantetheinyl transferase
MIDVHWLEQTETDLPPDDDWLSASEAVRLNGMRFVKRRADWRLGRWTAKRAVAAYLNLPVHTQALSAIELRPAPSGAPDVFVANRPAAVAVSLSHRAGTAICSVAPSNVALGCDLEVIEERSDAFVGDYFTSEEQALVARASAADRDWLLALIWSAKESVLKALRVGLRLDTRSFMVIPGALQRECDASEIEDPRLTSQSACPNTWRPLRVRYTGGQTLHGWWQHTGVLVRTLVATPPPAPPILLKFRLEMAPNMLRPQDSSGGDSSGRFDLGG